MHGQNGHIAGQDTVNDGAAEVNAVLTHRAFDEYVGALYSNIVQLEQPDGLAEQSGAHLDRGMTGLRIHATGMSNADDQIDIPHHLTENAGMDGRKGNVLIGLQVGETNSLQRGVLNIRWREPISHCMHLGREPSL